MQVAQKKRVFAATMLLHFDQKPVEWGKALAVYHYFELGYHDPAYAIELSRGTLTSIDHLAYPFTVGGHEDFQGDELSAEIFVDVGIGRAVLLGKIDAAGEVTLECLKGTPEELKEAELAIESVLNGDRKAA